MVRLFIENSEIDLDKSVQIAVTKQFEDLTNPTAIINDWSKTVSIPFTAKNNSIFGHIYCPDKITLSRVGSGPLTGVYFDPYKKLDMRLQYGDAVAMQGYAKMNSVKQTGGKGTYELTLFGQLGKVFQEMQKITFDTSTEDTSYLIDGSVYVDEYIDRNLVYSAWTSTGQIESELYPKYYSPGVVHPNYHVTDIIGFAPNNSFSEEFDYNNAQGGSNTVTDLAEYLNTNADFEGKTGMDAGTAIGDGMTPRGMGQFRSYHQLPYVYFNKLFQMFQWKAEEITGYSFELDEEWFNRNNPYWHNLVYMLKPLSQKDDEVPTNNYTVGTFNMSWSSTAVTSSNTLVHTTTEAFPLVNAFETYPAVFNVTKDGDLNINYQLGLQLQESGSSDPYSTKIYSGNALDITVQIRDYVTGTLLYEDKYLVCDSAYTASTTGYKRDNIIRTGEFSKGGSYPNRYRYVIINPTVQHKIQYKTTESFYIQYRSHWLYNTYRYTHVYEQGGTPTPTTPPTALFSNSDYCVLGITRVSAKRSYSYFNFNDLWNNEYNLFEQILNYCKMFRIGISVDEINKKVIFQQMHKYFENYSVVDWTNKIDKAKDFTITPLTFENKYVLFNYEDSDTQLGQKYKEKYGVNYGEYRLSTDYNFNDETTELFSGITPSILSSDNILSWLSLGRGKIVYTFAAEFFVSNKDEDDKQVDLFGSFYYHNGLASFDTDSNLIRTQLTDDCAYQQANNKYYFTFLQSDRIWVNTYPKLDVVKGDNMCVFNVPKENYTYLNNYSGKNSIYKNFWENYLNERYNTRNKLISCYVRLTPTDYINFKWNKFVKVGNQVCVVNKIYDYDITSTATTKVDLITVQDISAYTTSAYHYDYISTNVTGIDIPYDHYKAITVTSTQPWQVKSDDHTDFLDVWPTSGGSGSTTVYIGSINEETGYGLTFEQQDDDSIYTTVQCNVQSSSAAKIDVNPWYNAVVRGNTGQTTVSITGSAWYVAATEGTGTAPTLTPTSGPNGNTTVKITTTSSTSTGVWDFYLMNADTRCLQTIRVNVTAS